MKVFNGLSRDLEGTESCVWLHKDQVMTEGAPGELGTCQPPIAAWAGRTAGRFSESIPGLGLISLDIGDYSHVINVGQSLPEVRVILQDLSLVSSRFGKNLKNRFSGKFGFFGGFPFITRSGEFHEGWRTKARQRIDLYEEVILGPESFLSHSEPVFYFYRVDPEALSDYVYFMIERIEDKVQWIPWVSWILQGHGGGGYVSIPLWTELVGTLKASSAKGMILFRSGDEWNPEDEERFAIAMA